MSVPLRERRFDLIFIGFLALNAFFITYIVDLEQLVMEFLWKNGPATGEAVRAGVSKDRTLTDSTIQSRQRQMCGLLSLTCLPSAQPAQSL